MQKQYEIYKGENGTYGIRETERQTIVLPPTYERIGEFIRPITWVKRPEGYGLLNCETFQEIIPCIYGYPLYPNVQGQLIVWKNQKAGVIDAQNQLLIPIAYDNICLIKGKYYLAEQDNQYYWFDPQGHPIAETEELAEYTRPDTIDESEKPYYELSIDQLEQQIVEAYKRYKTNNSKENYEHAARLIQVRQRRLNDQWQHNAANTTRLDRVNTLLNDTVRKALALGLRTAQSLQWMDSEPNDGYSLNVGVYPCWTNEKSVVGYKPQLTGEAEQERLNKQEWNESDYHIWNIIRYMGQNVWYYAKEDNMCFTAHGESPYPADWAFETWAMEDGQSWDEGLHRPIYQNIHFLHPWHRLFWDDFYYALEDLAQMNEFRIDIKVTFNQPQQR